MLLSCRVPVVHLLGDVAKSKAKIAQTKAFKYLSKNYTACLEHLTADQSASGIASAEKILRPKWNDYKIHYDLWHKIYPFTGLWNTFVSQRTKAYGPYQFPQLRRLLLSGKLVARQFKSWWIHCSETAHGSAETFKETWLGAADHWAKKFFRYVDVLSVSHLICRHSDNCNCDMDVESAIDEDDSESYEVCFRFWNLCAYEVVSYGSSGASKVAESQ